MGLLVATSSFAYGQTEPPYGMSQLEAYSLFYENYRTGDYEMALTFGRWILEAKPRSIQGHRTFTLDTQFNRLINVYEELARQESDPSEKRVQLENALEIFDLTFETFTEEEIDHFRWTQRKGRFYQDHQADLEDGLQKAYEYYEAAYEMDPQRLTEMGDGYFTRILLDNYVSGGEREKALAMIEEVEEYAPVSLQETIKEAREELFSSPEERVVFLESRLEEVDDSERVTILSELADIYDQLEDREKAIDTATRLYELEPNFENTRKLADYSLSNAEYENALRYLKEALELAGTAQDRRSIALEISDTYRNIDDLVSARDYAQQAIEIDSSWGQPYLSMASIYAAAISNCISDRTIERDDRTVYWLAIDYLEEAIENDPSTRNLAERRIEQYMAVMPSSEDKFFREWVAGESFHIDAGIGQCYAWIDETTTIR